jgi:nicotinamidase-related amidase
LLDMSTNQLTLDPQRAALLVMDLQADIIRRRGAGAEAIVDRTAGAIAAAREARMPIIYIVVGFRPGYPEVSPRNASFAGIAQTGAFVASPPGSDIVAALRPQPEDVVVVKHRVSAFAGTDLEMILRARSIDTLVLLGLATSGVVLSTVRHAADADYRLVVVGDCCADLDDEVHRVLTEKVFPRQATVVAARELATALAAR